jgi:hypothetical protein
MKQPTREDYELAAKAAGMKVTFREYGGERSECVRHVTQHGLTISTSWNPLDDDGDSRRLQVACGIELSIYAGEIRALGKPLSADNWPIIKLASYADHNNDKCEAARHAVFWLAVEIGRAMP